VERKVARWRRNGRSLVDIKEDNNINNSEGAHVRIARVGYTFLRLSSIPHNSPQRILEHHFHAAICHV
jgi:hypothetical protein